MSSGTAGPVAVTADRPLLGPVLATLGWLRQARADLEAADPQLRRAAPAIRALRNIEMRVTRPVKIAVMGEFNAGKSTLTNFLLGIDGLPTAVVSNTCIPTSLSYAPTPAVIGHYRDGRRERLGVDAESDRGDLSWLDVRLPCERLRDFQLIDLPGAADPRRAMPPLDRARLQPDATIWCTAVTQAWRQTEQDTWNALPKRMQRHAMLAVTFADLLVDDNERANVRDRLKQSAGAIFREVVMLATLDARAAMQSSDPATRASGLAASGATALEGALERLAWDVMQDRTRAAQALAGRVAERALLRLGS